MSIKVIDTFKPKNGSHFPTVNIEDIASSLIEGAENKVVVTDGYGWLKLVDPHSAFNVRFVTEASLLMPNGSAFVGTSETVCRADHVHPSDPSKVDLSVYSSGIDNLQNQINQIIIDASSESVVAPEVVAARVGADSTSYPTLKDRLDTEVEGLKEEIDYLSDDFDRFRATDSEIQTITGPIVENSYAYVGAQDYDGRINTGSNVGYIKTSVIQGETLAISTQGGASVPAVVYYSSEEIGSSTFLGSSETLSGNKVYTDANFVVPSGASYAVVNTRNLSEHPPIIKKTVGTDKVRALYEAGYAKQDYLDAQLALFDSHIDDEAAYLDSKVSTAVDKANSALSTLSDISTAVSENSSLISENSSDIADLQGRTDAIESDISDYSSRIEALTDAVNDLNEGGLDIKDSVIQSEIDAWLDAHPDATTTVPDNSLTYEKLVAGTLGFVSPEMFGAAGDGETDDYSAIQNSIEYAISNGLKFITQSKHYVISNTIEIKNAKSIHFDFNGAAISVNNYAAFDGTLKQIGGVGLRRVLLAFSNCTNCDIINLALDLNISFSDKDVDNYGLAVADLSDCKISNVQFINGTFHYIYLIRNVVNVNFEMISFHDLGIIGEHQNLSDIFASGSSNVGYFNQIKSVRSQFTQGQLFYMAEGTYYINGVYSEYVPVVFDQRNGVMVAENALANHVKSIQVQTYSNRSTAAKVYFSNMRFINLEPFSQNIPFAIYITACEECIFNNIHIYLADDVYTGIYLRKFSTAPVENVTMKNIAFHINDTKMTCAMQFNDIIDTPLFENVSGLRSENTSTEAIRIQSTIEDPKFKIRLRDVYIPNSNGKAIYNGSDYQYIISEKSEMKIGSSAQRPALQWFDRGYQYYDTSLFRIIVWNGSTWV